MKYTTFRNLAAAGVVMLGLGTCWGVNACWNDKDEAQTKALVAEQQRREAERVANERRAAEAAAAARLNGNATAAAPANAKPPGLRPVDDDVLALIKQPAQEKIKDATKGKAYKVNLYSDDKTRWSRAKVDLNRNDKWDESWTFKADGSIERQVAPADDEKYSQTFRLDATSGWIDLAAPAPTPAAAPTPTATTATTGALPANIPGLRAVDQDLLALLKSATVQEKIKDATKGKPYKINLYSDDGARWNRAKIDLNRNDKWDESWTLKDGSWERQVAPADDEKYSEIHVLSATGWTKK